jgi:hypothetical protein
MLIKERKVSSSKDKKNVPAGESGIQKQKRNKRKRLIQLDDLIPKENVLGGHQLLFGVTNINQITTKQKEK